MDKAVFDEYEIIYSKILNNIYPAKNSTGFPERNLSVNFSKAYEKIAAEKGEESISWFELQFGTKNNLHVDAVIINLTAGELIIAEAKRFSNPLSKIREISADIGRIYGLVDELMGESRINMAEIRKCYGVILADVWDETGLKKDILKSYSDGQKNPQDGFLNRFIPEAGLNPKYDVRHILAKYYLLSFYWRINLPEMFIQSASKNSGGANY